MTYVIGPPCASSKDGSCVEVCPVSCIHPAPDEPGYDAAEQLYVDPGECIDCDACASVCPVDAIFAADHLPAEWAGAQERNAAYFGADVA
jgi:NAD-dependent dihydropyrimidine dehydrogenase PreA subunit